MGASDLGFVLALPFLYLWLLVARLLSMLSPIVAPWLSYLLAQKLYYATPFALYALRAGGGAKALMTRVGFEASYCMNVVRRYLTLPLRPHLPDFYIVGFPKCGTTSLCTYLKQHPSVHGLDGMPYHEVLSKESHFFVGAMGRGSTTSRSAYRSFFPTIVTSGLAKLKYNKFLCFDACPVHACLSHVPPRMANMTPNAKLIFMMRDPLAAVLSGELMLRDLGMPLKWTTMDESCMTDECLWETPEELAYWGAVEKLRLDDPLPEDLMQRFYSLDDIRPALRSAKYADCLEPFFKHFPKENMMFIDFKDFVAGPEETTRSVLKFVGADVDLPAYSFQTMPPGMQGKPRGRVMHAAVKERLKAYYRSSNLALQQMLGKSMSWFEVEV